MNSNDIKKNVFNGMFWSVLDRGGDQLLRFITSLFLARLILPEMFGLVAMVTVVFEIAQQIVNGGFGLSLINKKEHTRRDECTVFWFNIVMAVLCSTVIFFAAPYIGMFYKKTELVLMVRVLSISFFVSSLSTIQNILLMKMMDFRRQALISMVSTVISGSAGIVFALKGFEVWSLVIQLLTRSLTGSILLWSLFKWRPSFVFDVQSFYSMLTYGSKMFLSDIATIAFNNIYNIIIGRVYSANELAYFWRGKQLQQLPIDSIWAAIGRVAFPTFSLLKGDRPKLVASFRRAIVLLAFVLLPVMLIMASCSKNLILILYTETWINCATYLEVFCFAGAFIVMDRLIGNVVSGSGKSGTFLAMTVVQKTMLLVSVIISFRFGIYWMAVAFAFTMILCFFVDYILYCIVFKESIIISIAIIIPYIISSGLSYMVGKLMMYINSSTGIQLLLQGFSGFLVYMFINMVFKTAGLIEAQGLLRSAAKKLKLRQ